MAKAKRKPSPTVTPGEANVIYLARRISKLDSDLSKRIGDFVDGMSLATHAAITASGAKVEERLNAFNAAVGQLNAFAAIVGNSLHELSVSVSKLADEQAALTMTIESFADLGQELRNDHRQWGTKFVELTAQLRLNTEALHTLQRGPATPPTTSTVTATVPKTQEFMMWVDGLETSSISSISFDLTPPRDEPNCSFEVSPSRTVKFPFATPPSTVVGEHASGSSTTSQSQTCDLTWFDENRQPHPCTHPKFHAGVHSWNDAALGEDQSKRTRPRNHLISVDGQWVARCDNFADPGALAKVGGVQCGREKWHSGFHKADLGPAAQFEW